MIEIEEEIWKQVVGFDHYFISNFGRVKSTKYGYERFLKFGLYGSGTKKRKYYKIGLTKGTKTYTKSVHSLVAAAFLNYYYDETKDLFVDHIDNNPLNNNVNNLQIISRRENLTKDSKKDHSGIFWKEKKKVWEVYTGINYKWCYLGESRNKQEALDIYNHVLDQIKNNTFDIYQYRLEKKNKKKLLKINYEKE